MLAKGSKKDWIQTVSGRQFWPLAPRESDIHLPDIAHALSHLCRFTGHVKEFYSVAEHSVRVSVLAEQYAIKAGGGPRSRKVNTVARWGLMHDASEAYLADIASPVKRADEFAGYRAAEARLMLVIMKCAGLPPKMPDEVHRADGVLCATEAVELLGPRDDWALPGKPLPTQGLGWSPVVARGRFLERFAQLSWNRR